METDTWSCVDLHHSVFLAPDRIRTCCKRFFVDEEQRGDVVLFEVGQESPSAEEVRRTKTELYERINAGEPTACDGCPFLQKAEWGNIDHLEIRHLSFEYHSVCNLKCTYCSDEYYGGLKPQYDVVVLLKDFTDSGALKNCRSVVWGGGEPTIEKDFIALLTKVSEEMEPEQRVFTNSLKFSEELGTFINAKKVHITTSIDAGTEDIFRRIRGYKGNNGVGKVLQNLEKYSTVCAENVTVKYIFSIENCRPEQLHAFIKGVVEHNLTSCNFQLSLDFRYHTVLDELLYSILLMYSLLKMNNAERIFLDDLLWQRISSKYRTNQDSIEHQLADAGCVDLIADPSRYGSVVVWGAGQQATDVISKSVFFDKTDVAFFVDMDPKKQEVGFLEKEVRDPKALLEVDYPIYIASTQGYPSIVEEIIRMGIDRARVIDGIVL